MIVHDIENNLITPDRSLLPKASNKDLTNFYDFLELNNIQEIKNILSTVYIDLEDTNELDVIIYLKYKIMNDEF